jgi:hypothetical protein
VHIDAHASGSSIHTFFLLWPYSEPHSYTLFIFCLREIDKPLRFGGKIIDVGFTPEDSHFITLE